MQYTSASEGFYASIRAALYANGEKENGSANIGGAFSRFGVRGTNDLGGGLEGFYQYEAGIGIDNGRNPNSDGHSEAVTTRLGNVGLRGGFVKSLPVQFGITHITGLILLPTSPLYIAVTTVFPGGEKTGSFNTPHRLNGFQVAILGQFDSSKDGQGKIGATAPRFRIFTQGELDTAEADDTGIANDAGTVLTEDTFTDAHGTGNSSTKTYGTGDDASVVIFIDSSNNGDLNPGEVVVDTININPKMTTILMSGLSRLSMVFKDFLWAPLITVSRITCPKTQRELLVKIGMLGSSKPVMVKNNWSVGGWFPKIMLRCL